MKNLISSLVFVMMSSVILAQTDQVTVVSNDDGAKLIVNGQDFMINGMNWDYIPIGTNTVNANFWKKSDEVIRAGLDTEMSLLKNMNVNVIRQYTGVPARWIKYIYENYGIYTLLNHSFGRYGLTLNGAWTPVTDYADPQTQAFLMSEIDELVKGYKDTPGLLMYLLGNESNYGLFWAGAETEDFPEGQEKIDAVGELRGRPMYKLMNDAAVKIKGMDASHPVAICNGDVLFIDIIAEECTDVDVFGINAYRGVSFGDMFQIVKDKLDMPMMFTEFGADAYNAMNNAEDQEAQAYYMVGNWKEIYQNAAGLGKAENSIGGFTFQFSDGWWKFGFDDREGADVHDNNASWTNGGYGFDFREGENNMNEEWFGICAKGPTDARGLYDLFPRAAYYALKEAHQLNPYENGVTADFVGKYFNDIQLTDAMLKARGDRGALLGEQAKKLRLSGLRVNLNTYNTGGSLISTPKTEVPGAGKYPNRLGFDHMQSYFIGVEAKPTDNVRANVSFNMLGNVAQNPIDEIFYENRGRPQTLQTLNVSNGGGRTGVQVNDQERLRVYQADITWKGKQFDLRGFYRTGHYHWEAEGDFFGLYREANYGPNLDIYNGNAPFGFELDGKEAFKNLKVAFGPELWWGANPAVLAKYSNKFGHYDISAIFHEDLDRQERTVSSLAVPALQTRRATLHIKRDFGRVGVEIGGIWAGQPRVGETFQMVKEGDPTVYQDQIEDKDTWGGKVKITYSAGPFNWYGQGSAMGLVAGGGSDQSRTFTGWRLKDTGSGNQFNFLSGFTYLLGDFQIAPNFLWQKPIVGPIPGGVAAPGRPRNVLDDPFAVRANRETVAGEILFTYDPTPGTWMYEWDNDMSEDAPFAFSAGFVFRHLPTSQDGAIGFGAGGRSILRFSGAPPAKNLWEAHTRIVSKVNTDFGLIANLYGGKAQARGSDPRLIERFGGDLRMIYKNIKLTSILKVNDWGPFDYHRDFNLTFPLQLMADISTTVSKPGWFDLPNTRMGIRYTWRSLDQYSPRYCPTNTLDAAGISVCDPEALGFDNGKEWEFRTYFQINIGK